ncbi:MAG: helix-turn-helix transcriptional regulator [Tissierellia bacterium]|nr:helix-turn-helix transcriptional regulator [Tissierellia bacterium]
MWKEYELGKKIKHIREEKGLSQSQVVEKLTEEKIYMSRETLSKIENNSRSISAIELNALCKVFNVDIGDFFHEEELDDMVTFFRKRNFSENSLEEISELQEIVKMFINQEKIYKEEENKENGVII